MAMHACQIGPTDTAPPCSGSPLRACIGTASEDVGLRINRAKIKIMVIDRGNMAGITKTVSKELR